MFLCQSKKVFQRVAFPLKSVGTVIVIVGGNKNIVLVFLRGGVVNSLFDDVVGVLRILHFDLQVGVVGKDWKD